MIDHISIPSPLVIQPPLRLIEGNIRQRNVVDRKRNYFIIKRCFDLLFSSLFILCILSWLLPVLAIFIKLSSKGPVFFLQKRVGRGGKTFTCYKLRTMVVNAEADTRQADEGDSRITRLGNFLRNSNMDEFPQFFNVLKGDMSMVGPRPHMYSDCERFGSVIKGYKFRNLVKPGLTGIAQIKGYHGPANTRNAILLRYHWDQFYIMNAGFILDCKIIFFTGLQKVSGLFSLKKREGLLLQSNQDFEIHG